MNNSQLQWDSHECPTFELELPDTGMNFGHVGISLSLSP
jgi:hypothetical protein